VLSITLPLPSTAIFRYNSKWECDGPCLAGGFQVQGQLRLVRLCLKKTQTNKNHIEILARCSWLKYVLRLPTFPGILDYKENKRMRI
jgi:hypothetical protein